MPRGVLARRLGAAALKLHKCRAAPVPPAALTSNSAGVIQWNRDKFEAGVERCIAELKRERAEFVEEEELVRQRRCLPSSLEELERRALANFRMIFYCGYWEIRGDLHDLMLLLYLGALCKQQQHVTLLDYGAEVASWAERVRNGSIPDAWQWLRAGTKARDEARDFVRSDYFLGPVDDDDESQRDEYEHLEFKDLTVDDVASLIHALHQPESLLAKLMTPDPLLTHFENFHIALKHARLFQLRSELPIRIGLDVTYSDLASHVPKCEFPDCRKKCGAAAKALSEAQLLSAKDRFESPWFPFPSAAEETLRNSTVMKHQATLEQPLRWVAHLDPAACPQEAHVLVKRVMNTRRPYLVRGDREGRRGRYQGWEDITRQLGDTDGTMEEAEDEMYGRWANESPELRALLMRVK